MTDPISATVPVTTCPICGETSFSVLGERSDGIAVLRCDRCQMGVVAEHPRDTAAYYSDDYYSSGEESESGYSAGYSEYHMVATHSLAWAAELVRLLRQDGRILDVGCADGHLLRSLGESYEAYGIEVNEPMFRHCEALGIRMIGRDIGDPGLLGDFGGSFDLITAIATLEHVTDMRAAVEQMRDLLAPDGVLLFETPFISSTHDNSVWFRSSLEHVYYPTLEGLEYLFEDVFGLPLIGREVVIRSYASTFVGLATRGAGKHRHLDAWFRRLLDAPVTALESRQERSFRLYFDLIHAASPTPDNLALLAGLPPEQVTGPLLHRIAELWKVDLHRAEPDGRLEATQAALHEEQARSVELEAGRRWLEQQFFNWQQVAEERGGEITALREQVASSEQQIASGEAGRANLEAALAQERSAREDLAAALELERTVGAALEAALERERSAEAALEAALEERKAQIETLERSLEQQGSRLAMTEASLAAREEHIEKLLTSTSWKLTAPVRAVGRSLARVRRVRLGTAAWKVARFSYRLLPISGRARFKLRRAVLAWLRVPEDTSPELAVARLRDLVQGMTWRRAGTAASLLLRGDLASLKMHTNLLVQHSVNQETHRAILDDPQSGLTVRRQEPWTSSEPLVSVVIPCYNYGHFVSEAVDSVLAQTFQDFEILVVDGGSSASSVALLEDLQRPKTRVHFREGRHLVGDNRNYGISQARGKYVCCLDADDLLKPTYLEKALFLLETQDFDVVSTSIRCFGNKTDIYHLERFPVLADMLQGNHVSTCAVFRKELWDRAGGFQDEGIGVDYFYEDWRLWVRFAALGARIANIVEEPLFLYRIHSTQSLSSQNQAVPCMDRQREAMGRFNQDILTEEAFRLSEENRKIQVRMEDGFVNLKRTVPEEADRITILIAMPFFIIGGAERLLSEIAAHLGTSGFQVVLVTTEYVYPIYGDSTSWFERSTAEIYHLPRFLDPSRWQEFIFYLLETRNVSLLWIIGSRVFYDLLPRIKAAHPDLKVIDLLFNTIGHTENNRKHAHRFDKILVENREVATWLLEAGELPERVVQIPSGIDLDAYRPGAGSADVRGELGIAPGSFIAGCSGRLSEEKAPEDFLEIAHRCRGASDLVFLMTGAGPLVDQVRKRIEDLALGDRLRFLGQVDVVKDYMASYDVLILPSHFDGRPVAVLESLALGVPVIASRVGALPDLIQDGVTGFLCEPGDIDAFADRVRWLAAHPEEHRRMKAAARAFAEAELDARQMFERYEGAIREVLAREDSAKSQ